MKERGRREVGGFKAAITGMLVHCMRSWRRLALGWGAIVKLQERNGATGGGK